MQQNPNQQQLETFAVAAVEVQRINDDYQPRFAAASSFEEQRDIQQEAANKMTWDPLESTCRHASLSIL